VIFVSLHQKKMKNEGGKNHCVVVYHVPFFGYLIASQTTALGEPKPGAVGAPVEQQQGSVAGGLGRVVAEGFAFGVGSSIARSVVGSVFESFGGDASAVDGLMGGGEAGGGGENWGDEEAWSEDEEL
jgi:hypothetical protein